MEVISPFVPQRHLPKKVKLILTIGIGVGNVNENDKQEEPRGQKTNDKHGHVEPPVAKEEKNEADERERGAKEYGESGDQFGAVVRLSFKKVTTVKNIRRVENPFGVVE